MDGIGARMQFDAMHVVRVRRIEKKEKKDETILPFND